MAKGIQMVCQDDIIIVYDILTVYPQYTNKHTIRRDYRYKDTCSHCIQNSQFQFLVFNINYSLKYKITSLICQLLYTIKYIYLIGLASISTVIILMLSLGIFNPQSGHYITVLSGYLVNRPQASIRYSPGTISPRSQSSRLAENSRDGSQGVTSSL